jgi:hypothetical protein
MLSEDNKLKVWEQSHAEILGFKRQEVTEGWRKLHEDEFMICTLY